jgi:hypothetical protein
VLSLLLNIYANIYIPLLLKYLTKMINYCILTLISRRVKIKYNYLNNKDILKEIHRSKNSYCSYLTPDCADYDIIVYGVENINAKTIEQARENKSTRIAKLAYEQAADTMDRKRLDDYAPGAENIPVTSLVFRVMTWDHVPVQTPEVVAQEDEDLKLTEYDIDVDAPVAKPPANIKYVKCNFPPFQHYKLDKNLVPYCVGKSHWRGDLTTGHWSRDHGAMTKTLATMFIKLCERYATRANWRNYTYNDEMRSQALLQLSQIGLQFDEGKSQNPFAYYTATISNSFIRVLNIEKRNQNLRDDILEMNNFSPSYTRQNEGYGNHDD